MQSNTDADAGKQPDSIPPEKTKKRVKKSRKNRVKNLMLATDSAIDRLEQMTRPGGEIDSMDIKDLKSLITSIKDLAGVSAELQGDTPAGGVIILPEVKSDD